MAIEQITRAAARASGLPRYFTGKPCSKGHVAERYISGLCVPCALAKAAEWRKTNPERKRAAAAREYAQKRDETKARSRAWYAANKERARLKNRAWASDHKTEMCVYRMASRARALGCASDLTVEDLAEICAAGPECRHCGSNNRLTFDHIVSHAKGGANTKSNIQILCQSCNSKKQDRDDPLANSRYAA